MSDHETKLTRREALQRLAAAFLAAGAPSPLLAREVHRMTRREMRNSGRAEKRSSLSRHEYRTLVALTDLIIPEEAGQPGAVAAGVAPWIDMIVGANAELQLHYANGIIWLDTVMKQRHGRNFVGATREQQKALLDVIAYRRNGTANLKLGVDFFALVRRMTVDGFYTSRVGMRDIYHGNRKLEAFTVPEESLKYALERSGL